MNGAGTLLVNQQGNFPSGAEALPSLSLPHGSSGLSPGQPSLLFMALMGWNLSTYAGCPQIGRRPCLCLGSKLIEDESSHEDHHEASYELGSGLHPEGGFAY